MIDNRHMHAEDRNFESGIDCQKVFSYRQTNNVSPCFFRKARNEKGDSINYSENLLRAFYSISRVTRLLRSPLSVTRIPVKPNICL